MVIYKRRSRCAQQRFMKWVPPLADESNGRFPLPGRAGELNAERTGGTPDVLLWGYSLRSELCNHTHRVLKIKYD